LFLRDASIPPTNNSREQALRMSVIFRKVPNGFRSDWGRDLFAAVRSVVNTGKRQAQLIKPSKRSSEWFTLRTELSNYKYSLLT